MAILSPSQIHAVLKEEQKATALRQQGAAINLSELLEKHTLTADDALESLNSNMRFGDSSSIRQRAVETALKLNGLLDSENAKPDFHVTINILDSEFQGMNPILLPR